MTDSHILISTDTVGGVWGYSLALASGLNAQGISSTLAVLGPPANPRQLADVTRLSGCTLVQTGLPLDWCATSRSDIVEAAAVLVDLARRRNAKSAHLHAPSLAVGGWMVPVVTVAHSCTATWWDAMRGGPMPPDFTWRAQASLAGMEACDALIAPSWAFAADIRRVYGLNRPIKVVRNGVMVPPTTTAPREDHILAAGRLWDSGKNVSTLDRAAGRMRAEVRAAGSVVGPDGRMFHALHMSLVGCLAPDVLHASMSTAAAFASASLYEPFGLAVLEAAMTGSPLILSDIPTFRELWQGAALFVPAGDAPAWSCAMDALVEDLPKRTALGLAAQMRAREYSSASMVRDTAAVHHALTARTLQAA